MNEDQYHYTSIPLRLSSVKDQEHVTLFPFNSVGRFVKVWFLGKKFVDGINTHVSSMNTITFRYSTICNKNSQILAEMCSKNDSKLLEIIYKYKLYGRSAEYLEQSVEKLLNGLDLTKFVLSLQFQTSPLENKEINPYSFQVHPEQRKFSFVCNYYQEIKEICGNTFKEDDWNFTGKTEVMTGDPISLHQQYLVFIDEIPNISKENLSRKIECK